MILKLKKKRRRCPHGIKHVHMCEDCQNIKKGERAARKKAGQALRKAPPAPPVKVSKVKPFKWRSRELSTFWYWINERTRIYLARKEGMPFPWTKDKILREYKFTNAFRQLDRVTQAWTNRFCTLLGRGKKLSDGDLLFQCAQFRLFNWPETYDALFYGMPKWNVKQAIKILTKRKTEDFEQIFTGAYIVPAVGSEDPKIDTICNALEYLHDGRTKKQRANKESPNRHKMAAEIVQGQSMEIAVNTLRQVPTIGGFIGYEIACDLRFTRLLADAIDVNSWANPGPGAMRGIHRLLIGKAKWNGERRPDYQEGMRQLLEMAPREFKHWKALPSLDCFFEMREIEHSLCEFDKYLRVKNGEGKPRSRYRPPREPWVDPTDKTVG